ncbi:ATP-binding protein [Bradyrhizobium genosp. A]|uniref:ATP-binding protein n=1 Tax=Bradyrhizobium genosp. A TaxID=83626 RepID=UPI003CE96BF6
MSRRSPESPHGSTQPTGGRDFATPAKTRGRAAKTPAQNLITERKYVSILRADLHRSTHLVADLEVEESIARLAPALAQMRAAVHEHDGIIHREMGDGLFAVFGAPKAEDLHAVKACLAALDLLSRIEALGDPEIRVRIGVHSGLVVAGPRQLDYTRSYDFDGPPLIVAERLQALAAPNQALASEACQMLAAGYVQFETGETRVLKGFPQPVRVHPVKGIGELSKWRVNLARGGSTAFVGRGGELARLLSLANGALADRVGSFVVICGEAGVGKSRLAHETADALRVSGWQSIQAECSPVIGHSPFSLLRNLLSDVAAGLAESEMIALKSELSPAQSAALEVVLHGTASESRLVWAGLTPRARGRAIVEAASALTLRRIGERPTLLLIEDMQWADEASAPSIEAVTALAKRLPLLVLATARTDGIPAWLGRQTFVRLPLAPLERAAGLAMLDRILGLSPRLTQLKTRILHHTGAMPLFIEEVCRGLSQAGELTGTWGAFELVSAQAELSVPLTVQGVIASRIDRLGAREKRLLQVAAALGPRVESRLLLAISGIEMDAFRNSIAKLLSAFVLVPQSGDEVVSEQADYAFPHELVRQVTYDALLGPDKLALHARILSVLEAGVAAGGEGSALSLSLVHHAVQAHDWLRAVDYAVGIARQCVTKSALPDAARYFETALDALDKCKPSDERECRAVDLRIEARSAYANFGRVARWLSMAREAEARAEALGDGRRHTAALAVQAAALNFCGTPMEALEAGQKAVREAVRIADEGWLAYAQYGFGQALYVAGRYRDAVTTLGQAYNRFASGATPPVGGSAAFSGLLCSVMACISRAAMGEYAEAEQAQRQADTVASKDGGALAAVASGFSRGTLLLHRDDILAAEAALATALAQAHQHEINLFVPVIACQHGLALLLLHRVDEARRILATARKEAEDQAHRSAGLRAEIYSALCVVDDVHSYPGAIEAIRACCSVALQQGYDPIRIEAMLAESMLRSNHVAGEPAEADRCETEAQVIAARLGALGTLSHLRRSFARIFGMAALAERSI